MYKAVRVEHHIFGCHARNGSAQGALGFGVVVAAVDPGLHEGARNPVTWFDAGDAFAHSHHVAHAI